jgi:excisionase family DNA binding protein
MRTGEDSTALYVRLPSVQAGRLDRASQVLGLPKRELISGLVQRYVDPDSPRSLEALRRLGGQARPRRVTVDVDDGSGLVVGHHSFRTREAEVLSIEEAAELLQVGVEVLHELAEAGELPGRRLGGEWRFARAALIDWLAGR